MSLCEAVDALLAYVAGWKPDFDTLVCPHCGSDAQFKPYRKTKRGYDPQKQRLYCTDRRCHHTFTLPESCNRLEKFLALDTAVFVEAHRLGLQDADMPRKDATYRDDEVVFFGRTNAPAFWSSPPDAPVTLTLMATQGWKADMLALRALAAGYLKSKHKGQPGRRGYPLKALRYALNLRKKNPHLKAHSLRQKCLEKFHEDELPPDADSFRSWLNRPRKRS